MAPPETFIGGSRIGFAPTLWTDILVAKDPDHPKSRLAMETLITLYWKPVYFFLRRKGRGVEQAKDLTQEFFARLLERDGLKGVDRTRGKFRSYLLGALSHFLSDEHDRRAARKRTPILDFAKAEPQFHPARSFDVDWALTVLERALARLEQEDPRKARLARAARGERTPYAELATEWGTTLGAVKTLAHEARRRLRELLLQDLRATVARADEAEEELADLFRAFSS